MIDVAKLRRRMAKLKLTEKQVVSKAGISCCGLKLQGIIPLTLDEAEKLAQILEIRDSEFGKYFFSQ